MSASVISDISAVVVNQPVFDIPIIEPDITFNNQVKTLVLEGQLLEVTVPEMKSLWKLAQTLKEYRINGLNRPQPIKVKYISVSLAR